MMKSFIDGAEHIYLAFGSTDFRKQSDSLCALVSSKFNLDPYTGASVFIFCNKKRTSIKVLRYDKNGFILAQKKLIDIDKMKFEWPRNQKEIVVQTHKRQITKAGIRASKVNEIKVEIENYELPEGSTCDRCGDILKPVGMNYVRQRIEYVPAKIVLVKVYQMSYKCPSCSNASSDSLSDKFVKADIPRSLLNHSFVSSSLAARVIYQKYNMGIPLNRQERDWYDLGLSLPRSTTSRWCIKLDEYYLEFLVHAMHKKILESSELIHMDETSIQCNKEAGKKASSKSYMWVLRAGENETTQGVIFRYSRTRKSDIAVELTTGYEGIVVTDGYAGYNAIEGITHAECLCHMRRYLLNAIPHDDKGRLIKDSAAYEGFKYCNEIFKIERELSELDREEKKKQRQEKTIPVLEAFFAWVEITSNKVIVNTKLKEALTYAANQRKELSEFLNDGIIPVDKQQKEQLDPMPCIEKIGCLPIHQKELKPQLQCIQ